MKNADTEINKTIVKLEELSNKMGDPKISPLERFSIPNKIIALYRELYQTAYTEGFEEGYQARSKELIANN